MAQNWISEQHGIDVRNQIVTLVGKHCKDGKDVHRAVIARELGVTRSTAGKHVDILLAEKKLREVNGRMLELVPARKSPAKKATKAPAVKKVVAKKAPAKASTSVRKVAAKRTATVPAKAPAKKTTRKAAASR